MNTKKRFSFFIAILLCILLWGCGGESSIIDSKQDPNESGEPVNLEYATQLQITKYQDGYGWVHINDGLDYFVVPENMEIPDWLQEPDRYCIIKQPINSMYLAASSTVDLVDALGEIEKVSMTSTQANNWSIDEIRKKVEDDEILYIGKYSAPDFEALLELECDLTIESTMIYHNPEIKEAIEALNIPVLVERSSYERHPLARLEWIKLYGYLLGEEDKATEIFEAKRDSLLDVISEVQEDTSDAKPKVAFFSISTNGYATVRKPGDYICQMIELAGGEYALDDLTVPEDNALSTTNIQLESFFEYATKADVLIYNSAIQSEVFTTAELLDKFSELAETKAVKDGNVWATSKSVYQKSSAIGDMTEELYLIISGRADDKDLVYFHKLT